MKLSLQCALKQMPCLVCSVCGQIIETERLLDEVPEARLFGWRDWGMCPCCWQKVESDHASQQSYRMRCVVWVRKHAPAVYERLTKKGTQ